MPSVLFALLLLAEAHLNIESTVADLHPVRGNAALLASGIPDAPAELRQRVLHYLHARSAALLDVTPDGGQLLIATRFGGTRQMHLVDHPRGDRYQLTFGEEPIGAASFVPGDPDSILYLQDSGGGELFQIHRFDRRTGRSTRLSDGKSRHESLHLSRDGKLAAFSSTSRNGKDTDVFVAPIDDFAHPRALVAEGGTWNPVDFSPDGKELLVVHFRSVSDADLSIVEVESGLRRQLTPKEGHASIRSARFTADGKGVYVVTNRWSDFDTLYRLDLGEGAAPQPLTAHLRWDVEHVSVARDGSKLALTVNADGYSQLHLLDLHTGKLAARDLPAGIASAIAFPTGRSDQLVIEMQSARTPGDVFHLDLKTGQLVRWTRSETGGLALDALIEPTLVRYPSTDGVQVPAFLYRAKAAPGVKQPVIVVWHGGPEGQSRPGFSPFAQMLAAELGAAVLLPNVRGSDGYGKAYLSMDDGIKREASLADIGATFDWIATQPDLDPDRVAVYGGSYGGYMTLASVAFFPKRVRAGVDVVGISSLPTFLKTTQGYHRDLRRAEYGDERDPAVRAVQERISPLAKVDSIEASLFVQQGKNDPRVPQSEAEQLVRALRSRGRDVWYLLALDEGHGFKKKANSDYAAVATVMFLRSKLLKAPANPL